MGHITALFVDGKDTSDLGVVVAPKISGFKSGPEREEVWQRLPDRLDAVRLTAKGQWTPRQIVVRGVVEADTNAIVRSRVDEVKYRVYKSDLAIAFNDDVTRQYTCFLDGEPDFDPIGAALVTRRFEFEIPLIALNPAALAAASTAVTVSSTAGDVDIPLGTAPSIPSISVSSANFTLTYKSSTGGTVASLAVAGATSSPVIVDMDRKKITSTGGGNEIDAMSTGSNFFSLDPIADGDVPSSGWPTVSVSAGVATVTYTKSYL
jgi:hypothetical protein